MSWNQSICFSKNKLAWSGCGLVWQVWSDMVRLDLLSFGGFGLGLAGWMWSDMFRLGLYSFGGSGLGLAGKVRWR
jgi:hypothetical protein